MNRFVLTAAALMAAFTSADAAETGRIRFENGYGEKIVVDILHSDGALQKKETIKPDDGHGFSFSGCRDKKRQFEIRLASDGTVVGSGSFHFEASTETGLVGTLNCELKLLSPSFDTPVDDYTLDFTKISRKRGRFRAHPATGQ